MSYRPGLSPGAARVIGEQPRSMAIICDSCGFDLSIVSGRSGPPAWFFAGHAPPRWTLERGEDGLRRDTCPACKEKP